MRPEMNIKDIIPMSVVESLLLDPQRTVERALEVRDACENIMDAREFGKTMYLVYEGQLRQFKIKKGMKFPFFNYRLSYNEESFRHVLILDIAGVGERAVKADMYGYRFAFNVYDTIEDFKGNKPYQLSRKYLNMDKLGEIYSNVGTMRYSPLVRYIWNGTSAQAYPLKDDVSLFFTYDKNGFDNQMKNEDYFGYVTKEECERDNAIQVAVFADEEEKEDEVVQEVIVRCSIEINGVEYDVVNEETLAAIRKILNY